MQPITIGGDRERKPCTCYRVPCSCYNTALPTPLCTSSVSAVRGRDSPHKREPTTLWGSDGDHGVLHRPRDLQRRECTGAVRVRAGAGSGGAVSLHRNRTHAHRRRDGPLGGRGKLPAQNRRSGRGRLPPDAARPSRRLLPLRGAPCWCAEPGLRRALRHLLAVRPLLQIPSGVRQSEALAAAAAHAHLLHAGGSGSTGRRAQKETAQHDSVGGPGVLCQEDL